MRDLLLSCLFCQAMKRKGDFERKWSNFQEKVEEGRIRSSEKFVIKLQEFMFLVVELNEPSTLAMITGFCKKINLARKKLSEELCMAYAIGLLSSVSVCRIVIYD